MSKADRISMGMGVGVAIGVALGTALHQLAIWLPLGIVLGSAIALLPQRGQGKRQNNESAR